MTWTLYIALSVAVAALSYVLVFVSTYIILRTGGKIAPLPILELLIYTVLYMVIHTVLAPIVLLSLLFARKDMMKILAREVLNK